MTAKTLLTADDLWKIVADGSRMSYPSRDHKGAVAFSEPAPPLAGARGSDSPFVIPFPHEHEDPANQ